MSRRHVLLGAVAVPTVAAIAQQTTGQQRGPSAADLKGRVPQAQIGKVKLSRIQFAFQNGADFVCVGMFDWQVVDDVNTALNVLAGITNRERLWRA